MPNRLRNSVRHITLFAKNMHLRLIPILIYFVATICTFGASVAKDGFPTGQNTAEGVAADLARAFIKHDYSLFEEICLPLYGGKEVREGYGEFRSAVKKAMRAEAKKKKDPFPGGPKSIRKVFAARQLSISGPASYGYAVFGFEEVQFVDVEVLLVNDQQSRNRTLVMKKSGKWYVHPMPLISPLLCMGLNEESESVTDWTEKSGEQVTTGNAEKASPSSTESEARRP